MLKNLLCLTLGVGVICGAVGWLLLVGATYDYQKEIETLKAVMYRMKETTKQKVAAGSSTSMEYRLSCHELASGDAACDVYAQSGRSFCWWMDTSRPVALRLDRMYGNENCAGYFVCSHDFQRVNMPAGPEVDENQPQSESDLHPMGK